MSRVNLSSINTTEIFDGVYQININEHVYSYLIKGQNKCILIDTGWGTVDLKKTVEELTGKEIIVINTHGHLDHIFGNYQFENTYLRDEDLPLVRYDFTPERRSYVFNRYAPNILPDNMSVDAWLNAVPQHTLSLNSLQFIELGDRVIEVIHTPGHTLGCVCLIDPKKRLLFSGDSIVKGYNMLHFNLSADLKTYCKSLNQIYQLKGNYDYILPAHEQAPLNPNFLDKLIQAVQKVLNREVIGELKEIYGKPCIFSDFQEFQLLYRENSII